jgi:ATP-binding cassette subfamily C protein CydCD
LLGNQNSQKLSFHSQGFSALLGAFKLVMIPASPVPSQQQNLHLRLIREVGTKRVLFAWVITTGIIASLAGIGGAWSLSLAVSAIFLRGEPLSGILLPLACLLVLIVTRGWMTGAGDNAAGKLAVQIKTSLRERLFDHILKLGPAYTQRNQTGNLVNLLTEGMEALQPYYSQYLPQAVFAVLIPLAILVCITPLDPLSGLILFLTAPIIPIFMVLIASLSTSLAQRQWKTLSRLSAYFLDILQGLTTIKLLGRNKDQEKKIAQASDQFREITMNVLRVTFLSALVMELTGTLSTAIIAVEIGIRLLYGKIAFEPAFFVLVLVPEFYLPLRLLGLRFHSGMAGAATARQMFEILDEPLATNPTKEYEELDTSTFNLSLQTVRFDQVSHAYSKNQTTLEAISFTIQPGQMVALVGPSGAGKSTLASLLLRLYPPSQGQITANGIDIQNIPKDTWLQQVAWVPQKPFLFDDSVAANIRLGRPSANLEEIKAAAQFAHADEFILDLPDGYETRLGERGLRLSGGQAQRIALARAFLKDTPLLILDEPTSNLDPETENLLQDSLRRLVINKMVLIIAHRMSTVYQSDLILVLEKGKLVECGNHHDLIQNRGLYWQMVIGGKKSYTEPEVSQAVLVSHILPDPDPTWLSPLPENVSAQARRNSRITQPLYQLFSLLSPFKGWVLIAVLLGFLAVASGIGLISTSTYIISVAALQPSIATLQVAIVGVRFFGIARALFRYLERLVSHQVTFKLLAQLRVWIYHSLEPLAPAFQLKANSGDLLSRIIGDVGALENFYVRGAAPLAIAILITLSMVAFMGSFSPWLSLVTAIFMVIGGVILPFGIWSGSKASGAQIIRTFSQVNSMLIDGIQGLFDLTAFSQVQSHFLKTQVKIRTLSQLQETSCRLNSAQNALFLVISNLAFWMVLVIGASLVNQGDLNGVLLGVLCLAALAGFEAVQTLPQAAVHLGKDFEATRRLMDLSQAKPQVLPPSQPAQNPDNYRLEWTGVSFSYPAEPSSQAPTLQASPGQRPQEFATAATLSDISFTINPGEHLAIVGPSGAGKSTLVNLLVRFWDYQAGRISLGGFDLRCYDPDDLHGWMNILPQNTHLFTGTIRENLLLANPRANADEIERAIHQAHLYELVQSLPKGNQTWIGEQGLRLSAGERQRLALARFFLKDAPICILDEPTANLDPLLEGQILANIHQHCRQRTRLTITHRLVGLDDTQEILVLQGGKVIERGSHAELVLKKGLYQQMLDLQNQAMI